MRLVLLAAAVVVAGPGAAQDLTQDEALALAFPTAELERRTAFLDDDELARARTLAGEDVEVDQGVVTYYLALRDGRPVGAAYFDAHRVRTLAEVVMVVVDDRDRIERLEVLRFMEPPDYRAPDGWIDQLEGRRLDDGLSLKGGVATMTGATLTARALVRASRRVLALHAVIRPFEEAR